MSFPLALFIFLDTPPSPELHSRPHRLLPRPRASHGPHEAPASHDARARLLHHWRAVILYFSSWEGAALLRARLLHHRLLEEGRWGTIQACPKQGRSGRLEVAGGEDNGFSLWKNGTSKCQAPSLKFSDQLLIEQQLKLVDKLAFQ
jgi:hypothetical protein